MNATFEKIKRIYSASSGPIFIVGCFWIHVWFVWFFLRIGIIPIAVLSTISCIVYLMPLVMKKENLEQNVIFLIFCEIAVFSLISTMILSMRCGFFIYCLPLPLTSYIEINDTRRKKILFLGATVAMLLLVPLSDLAGRFFSVYRQRMEPYNYMFLLGNFFVVVASYGMNVYVYMKRRERMVKETKYNSEHDALTGIHNRTYFYQYVADAVRRDAFHGCFIMVDIDNFKKINDQYGHDVGDVALQTVARTVKEKVRENDLFVRWGGEEFVIFIEKISLEDAEDKAEFIREALAGTEYHDSKYLTVSVGVTEIREEEGYETALKRADENLYVAKTTGKNKVVAS